jgi:ABC-type Fe3+/spermidine/putrescine transport system ATPase subunit
LTTIIVTHDREEAFELADRIAVLVDGEIQQHAQPAEVYEHPANLTVARFMGVNVLPMEILGEREARLEGAGPWRVELPRRASEGPRHLAIVPERTWTLENHDGMKNVLPGQLLRTQYLGGEYRLYVRIGDPHVGPIVQARSKESPRGKAVFIHLPAEALHVFQEPTLAAEPAPVEQPPASRDFAVFKEEIL